MFVANHQHRYSLNLIKRMTTTPTSAAYNLIVLDESGSMEAIKKATLTGFREIVQTILGTQQQFPEQSQYVTLVTFNGLGIKTLIDNKPAQELADLPELHYQPDASTPLYDALGKSLLRLELQTEKENNPTVLVSVLTDGEENASREFSGAAVKAIIERLRSRGWTFTYMGSNHDVEKAAASVGINNTVSFKHDERGTQELFEKDRKGRMAYYFKKSQGMSSEDAEKGFFDQ
jgi:Mg-chelatase subunit ChlD